MWSWDFSLIGVFVYATGCKLLSNCEESLKGVFVDVIITEKWLFEDDF